MPQAVNIVLDLQNASRQPSTASDFLSLWQALEEQLHGASLQGSASWQVDVPPWGTCGLLLADPEDAPRLVTEQTPFVVRSVLEPSRVLYKCATCTAAGREAYGPFICASCKDERTPERVCDEHVVLLDGSFRATCPRHSPTCSTCGTGTAGTFWCRGPNCRGSLAHCDRHRRSHPGDQAIGYCPACYAVKFPECGHPGCTATGSLACEFVDQDTFRRCGTRACSEHAYRWQVLGPHRRGPVLCLGHKQALPRLSREQLTFQIVATVGAKGGPGPRDGARPGSSPGLPGLFTIRHIFVNTRNEALPVGLLNMLFTQLQHSLGSNGLAARMRNNLERQEKRRLSDVGQEAADERQGRAYFARLQQILARDGKLELANAITYSYFRQRSGILWVRVPDHMIGLFIGRQGSTIRSLSQRLGVTVQREEK
jgi:hypothetical protein